MFYSLPFHLDKQICTKKVKDFCALELEHKICQNISWWPKGRQSPASDVGHRSDSDSTEHHFKPEQIRDEFPLCCEPDIIMQTHFLVTLLALVSSLEYGALNKQQLWYLRLQQNFFLGGGGGGVTAVLPVLVSHVWLCYMGPFWMKRQYL